MLGSTVQSLGEEVHRTVIVVVVAVVVDVGLGSLQEGDLRIDRLRRG